MQKAPQQARWGRTGTAELWHGDWEVQDKRGRSRMEMNKGVPMGGMDAPGLWKEAQGNNVSEEPAETGQGRSRGEERSRYSRRRAAVQLIHVAAPTVHGRHR